MKNLILLFALGLALFTSCNKEEVTDLEQTAGLEETVEQEESVILSDQEKSDLLFLREEEKLARDVYNYAYNKYNQNIFNNISNSEQSHINSVLVLLNKYNIPDPVANNESGIFSNNELQSLYNDLTSKSDTSLSKALEVGVTIEDLDINDINIFKSHTTKSDLINVYNNLSCGSRNHLRSFVGQLGNYTPIYISQSEYDAIISTSNEKCGK
ncbi:DUF2202 domain-containing protein [Flavobacteriaceae bacterium]|nr:DUF2202 domain-containing protein [Flavobacteriaceae bacterium]